MAGHPEFHSQLEHGRTFAPLTSVEWISQVDPLLYIVMRVRVVRRLCIQQAEVIRLANNVQIVTDLEDKETFRLS